MLEESPRVDQREQGTGNRNGGCRVDYERLSTPSRGFRRPGKCSVFPGKYRIIESCSNEMNFSRLQTADFEGLLAASQEISRQQAAEIQPLYYSQLKMKQDVGWIFRSGNAERREAMQRIVDRSDAKPGRKRRPQMLHFYLRRVLMRHEHCAAFP